MANMDFALTNDDLLIQHGDFVIGYSDDQHIKDTINAFPGTWKEFPADGVGMRSYINSSGQEQEIERLIIINLQSDSYESNPVLSIDENGKLLIYPNATKL